MKTNLLPLIIVALLIGGAIFIFRSDSTIIKQFNDTKSLTENLSDAAKTVHPLSIEALRQGDYPGSDIVIEETLAPGSNYARFITSYQSEGLKIYALLTVPNGDKPATGWPVIVFNHGYIPPAEYRSDERYIAYTDAFSRNGYIVFRPDYRGHGNSEGEARGGYGTNDYTIDVLNAVASIKKYPDTDPARMGMWGHSMGGYIGLRTMVVSKDIKAADFWAGVVGSYEDLLYNWRRPNNNTVSPPPNARSSWRQTLINEYGEPKDNPEFWDSISSTAYLADIAGPIQIQHGTADTSVPVDMSTKLDERLKAAGKSSTLYIYEGDDHNIANNLSIALERSVTFFDEHVKGI